MRIGVNIRLTAKFVAIALLLLGLAGCAGPTKTVAQGKNLSASGIHYAEIIDDLITATTNQAIEYDSDELLAQRKRTSSKDTLDSFLKERDDSLLRQVEVLQQFHGHALRLKAYFINLQALADSNFQVRNASAVKELSDNLNDTNKKVIKSKKMLFSKNEQDYLDHLTGLVSERIQAVTMKTALKRDARIIGEQLILHEKLIADLKDMLADRYQCKCDDFRQQKIRSPYIDKQKEIDPGWKKDRHLWIDCSLSTENLDQAVEAAKHMRAVWQGILQGEEDTDAFSPLLRRLEESIDNAKDIQNDIERSLIKGIEKGPEHSSGGTL